jgi:hypothetical protein
MQNKQVMTPKEKAEELADKMLFCFQGHIDEYTAKQCALIAVDEIIKATIDDWSHSEYWEEVKQELEKL